MNNTIDILKFLQKQNEPKPFENIFRRIPTKPTSNSSYDILDLVEGVDFFNAPIRSPSIPSTDALNELSLKGLPTNSKDYWWVKYPKRALSEIKKMHSETNATFKPIDKKLVWDEVIKNNFGTKFYISIETLDYPHKMPATYVREAEIKFRRGKHMFRDGKLCLMHSDDYNSKISILGIRNSACAWCWAVEVYTHTGKWPTAEAD